VSERTQFDDLSREDRIALCREVMENLSDLVEDTAPPDFCEKVETMLGSCQPYLVYKDTLAATLGLLKECGGNPGKLKGAGEECYARGVARAQEALMKRRRDEKK
jgi:hypothetical protein